MPNPGSIKQKANLVLEKYLPLWAEKHLKENSSSYEFFYDGHGGKNRKNMYRSFRMYLNEYQIHEAIPPVC